MNNLKKMVKNMLKESSKRFMKNPIKLEGIVKYYIGTKYKVNEFIEINEYKILNKLLDSLEKYYDFKLSTVQRKLAKKYNMFTSLYYDVWYNYINEKMGKKVEKVFKEVIPQFIYNKFYYKLFKITFPYIEYTDGVFYFDVVFSLRDEAIDEYVDFIYDKLQLGESFGEENLDNLSDLSDLRKFVSDFLESEIKAVKHTIEDKEFIDEIVKDIYPKIEINLDKEILSKKEIDNYLDYQGFETIEDYYLEILDWVDKKCWYDMRELKEVIK